MESRAGLRCTLSITLCGEKARSAVDGGGGMRKCAGSVRRPTWVQLARVGGVWRS